VTFDGEAVSPEAVEGPDGYTGALTVAAPGFALHEQELTLSDGMEVDLGEALRAVRRPGKRRIGPGKRPTGKRGASHIEGRRPGSKIKVISRPAQ